MEILVVAIITLETLAVLYIAIQITAAFKTLYIESLSGDRQAIHGHRYQPNGGDTIHNHFLLELAIEADGFRQMKDAANNEAEKARYCDSMNGVSIEVVDTVLAMNGFDPHAGEIFGAEDDDEMFDNGLYCDDPAPVHKG